MNQEQSEDLYVIKYDDGYYADHQPNYHWSYTEDITKARTWKTLVAVNNHIRHSCSYDTETKTAYCNNNPVILKIKKIVTIEIIKQDIEARPFKYKCNYTLIKNVKEIT